MDFITQETCANPDTGLQKAQLVEARCLIPTPNNHTQKREP